MTSLNRSRALGAATLVVLLATGCPAGPQPAAVGGPNQTVSAPGRPGALAAPRQDNLGGLTGQVLGPGAGVLANNSASVIADGGAGLLSDRGAGLVSLTKYRLGQAATPSAVVAAQVEVQDAQGRRIAEPVPTDASGAFSLPRVGPSGTVVYVVARYVQDGHPVTLMRVAAAPRAPGLMPATVDVATTLVAKKTVAALKRGTVSEDGIRPEALERLARELAPLMSARAVAAVALLAEEQTARVFDTMLTRVEEISSDRRAAIGRADAGQLTAAPAGAPTPPAPATPDSGSALAPAPSPTATNAATGGAPTPLPTTTPTQAPRVRFGAYRGVDVGATTQHLPALETWLGRPVDLGLDYAWTDAWDNMRGRSAQLDAWQSWKAARAGRQLLLSAGLLPGPNDGTGPTYGVGAGQAVSLEIGATGAYDEHWRALATALVARGLADTTLCLGHDFNLPNSAWSARGKAAAYAGYYRKVVAAMRSVAGAGFTFEWHPAHGGDWPTEDAYPGDDVVDVVALSVYDIDDQYPTTGSPTPAQVAAARATRETGTRGLAHWRAFAESHGRPMAIGGWGLWAPGTARGGGDNPDFVAAMHAWVNDPAHRTAYHVYFDSGGAGGFHLADDGPYPSAARRFRELFGP